jgi:hypothetical protein
MNEICRGLLKQQIVDENGLYKWESKYFLLKISKAILIVYSDDYESRSGPSSGKNNENEVQEEDDDEEESVLCRLSLIGSKYAKEWSISTPAIGSFGFDILWSSGRIWSFLAEDEFTCKRWVQAINETIERNPIRKEEDRFGENKIPFQRSEQSVNQSSTRTEIEELSPQRNYPQQQIPLQQTTQRYHRDEHHTPSGGRERRGHEPRQDEQNLFNHLVNNEANSLLSTIPPHSSPSDISPESNVSDHLSKARYHPGENESENEVLEPYNMMADEPNLTKTRHARTTSISQHSRAHTQTQTQTQTEQSSVRFSERNYQKEVSDQLTYMTERCQYYCNLSEDYLKEADAARAQLEHVREEWSQKYSQLETKIRLLTEKDLRNSSVCFSSHPFPPSSPRSLLCLFRTSTKKLRMR